ncbi:MAG: hypothetical protein M0P33_09325, partial [Massilibacteroides sp.]|nr:hypothetical protein [Massilibacteroides sp.]
EAVEVTTVEAVHPEEIRVTVSTEATNPVQFFHHLFFSIRLRIDSLLQTAHIYCVFKGNFEKTVRSSGPGVCGKDRNTIWDSPPMSLVWSAEKPQKGEQKWISTYL